MENDELRKNNELLSAEVESMKSLNEKVSVLEQLVNELTSVKQKILKSKNQNITFKNKEEKK